MTVTAGDRSAEGTNGNGASSGESAPQPPGSQPPAGSQPTNEQRAAAERVEAADEELTRLRSELETANKTRIPDLQRAISAAEAERDTARDAAKQADRKALRVHQSWLEWAKQNVTGEQWKAIEGHEQERTGKVLQTQAARADTLEVINEAYRNGDIQFAKFLERQDSIFKETGQGRITRDALPHLRKMYDELRPSTAPAATTPTTPPSESPRPTSGQQPAAPATPPRTIAPSGAPPPGGEPFYRKGDSPTSMWNRLFKKGNRASLGQRPQGQ